MGAAPTLSLKTSGAPTGSSHVTHLGSRRAYWGQGQGAGAEPRLGATGEVWECRTRFGDKGGVSGRALGTGAGEQSHIWGQRGTRGRAHEARSLHAGRAVRVQREPAWRGRARLPDHASAWEERSRPVQSVLEASAGPPPLSSEAARAAAVGSLITRNTFKPAIARFAPRSPHPGAAQCRRRGSGRPAPGWAPAAL